MRRWAVLLGLAAVGCGQPVDRDKDAVAALLRDPESAQFRNVRRHNEATCGEVNGRNAFGAYAGHRRFVVTSDGRPVLEPTPEAAGQTDTGRTEAAYFNIIWIAACGAEP